MHLSVSLFFSVDSEGINFPGCANFWCHFNRANFQFSCKPIEFVDSCKQWTDWTWQGCVYKNFRLTSFDSQLLDCNVKTKLLDQFLPIRRDFHNFYRPEIDYIHHFFLHFWNSCFTFNSQSTRLETKRKHLLQSNNWKIQNLSATMKYFTEHVRNFPVCFRIRELRLMKCSFVYLPRNKFTVRQMNFHEASNNFNNFF